MTHETMTRETTVDQANAGHTLLERESIMALPEGYRELHVNQSVADSLSAKLREFGKTLTPEEDVLLVDMLGGLPEKEEGDVNGYVYFIGGIPVGARGTGSISGYGLTASGSINVGYQGWGTTSRTYSSSFNLGGVSGQGTITSVGQPRRR